MLHRLPALQLAALAMTASLASAQTAQPHLAPSSAVPAYRSAMEGYVPFADEKIAPWKDANENVGRIGGWRAYARESQGAAPAAPPPTRDGTPAARPASAPKPAAPAADPHGGHKH